MQATMTLATWNRRKLALLATALGLLLALVAVVFILQTTRSEGQAGSPSITIHNARAAAEARFRALNELPDAPAVNPLSANPRFIAMNQLPEARKATSIVAGQSRIGFLESNGAESVVLRAAETYYPAIDRDEYPN